MPAAMRSMVNFTWSSSSKCTSVSMSLPERCDPHRVGPVDHDLGKRFVVQQVLERTEVVQVVDGRAQHLLVGVVGDAAGLVDEALGHEVVERRVVDDGADDRGRVAVASCRVAVGLLGLVVG